MSGYHKRDFETFPVHTLKRVDRPTTIIHDDQVQRVDERESGFNKAVRGDYGPVLQKERARFVPKHPISGALSWMTPHLKCVVDGFGCSAKGPLSGGSCSLIPPF
jgi:hypothetical protein